MSGSLEDNLNDSPVICLFKQSPLESPGDAQFSGNVVSPKYKYNR